MKKSIEQKRDELADNEVQRFNHKDAWMQNEMRKCGHIGFQAGFDAALKLAEERAAEREKILVEALGEIKKYHPTKGLVIAMPTEAVKQIYKIASEALEKYNQLRGGE